MTIICTFAFFSDLIGTFDCVWDRGSCVAIGTHTPGKSKYLYKLDAAVTALVHFLQFLTEHAATTTNTTYNIIQSPNFLEERLCS